jgi:hypothetical protein
LVSKYAFYLEKLLRGHPNARETAEPDSYFFHITSIFERLPLTDCNIACKVFAMDWAYGNITVNGKPNG